MNTISYKSLKTDIIKSCKQMKGMQFEVDYVKLADLVADLGLIPLKTDLVAKHITPEMIPFLSEFYKKTHLSWISDSKYFTVVAFIDKESLDEKATKLIDLLSTPQEYDPDIDKVKAISTLIAEYPCYHSTIISYQNDNPNREGRPSYNIVIRANKVVIESSDYKFNAKDFA